MLAVLHLGASQQALLRMCAPLVPSGQASACEAYAGEAKQWRTEPARCWCGTMVWPVVQPVVQPVVHRSFREVATQVEGLIPEGQSLIEQFPTGRQEGQQRVRRCRKNTRHLFMTPSSRMRR